MTDKSESAGGRVVLWLLAGLLVLFGGGYVALHQLVGDKVPQGVKVLGTEIGGQDRAQAVRTVDGAVGTVLDEPVTLVVAGKEHPVVPSEWGVSVDAEATVEAAGAESSWSPSRLFGHFTGGGTKKPVLDVDEQVFDEHLATFNDSVGTAAVDGTVGFKGGKVVTTQPRKGHGVDTSAVQDGILNAIGTDKPFTLNLTDIDPRVTAEVMEAAQSEIADPAVSAPVTVNFGETSVKLSPAQFSPALSMVPRDGALALELDTKKLDQAIKGSVAGEGKPVDASVKLVKGKPTVIPAKPGVTYDAKQLDGTFLDAVAASGDQRTITVKAVTQEADFTTEDAEKLGVKEKISEFRTEYPGAEYRNINIGRAAELVNGTLLLPGETFSLNGTVGERTRENGFTEGTMIANGVFKEDLGGGVSQMATTTYNAMFFAGLKDVEHKPHSFYISRYPEGREATVAWGSVDLKFKNDTKYGVLIESFVNPAPVGSTGSVTVRMYSTKVWDITTKTGGRYAFTSPGTRYINDSSCVANSGYGGFDVDYQRFFSPVGSKKITRTEDFHTTYTPADTVICGPEPKPQTKAPDAAQ